MFTNSSSDHSGISLTLQWKAHRAKVRKSKKVWFYDKGDYEKACRLIDETDWNCILNGNDINTATSNWTQTFLSIMEQCIPHRYLRQKVNLPWLTKEVIQLIRKRNILYRKAKKSQHLSHFTQYKKIRNKVISLIRYNKMQYFNSLATASNKVFWKTIKQINKNRSTIPQLLHCDQLVSDDKHKADILNDYFASCWNTLEKPLDELIFHDTDNLPPFEDTIISAEQVFNLISQLDTNKANGPDGISAFMLKSTASSIASPLAKLFSCSILTGKFPTIWKIASIVPIPKSGHKNDPSNYRPISLLSIVSKLLEKIVYSRLWEDLVHGSSISECQWGFQKHKSTTTALLSTTHEWFQLMDRKLDVMCVFFDYKKAFDSVPHRRLMERLLHIGVQPLILSWLCSYLSNRQQYVRVNGENSRSTVVRSGVPQGSVLGPLLFLLYINDITNLHLFKNAKLTLYADDMLLYKPITCSTSYDEIQQDVNQLSQWSDENMLSFNTNKCKCLLLSNKSNRDPPPIILNSEVLESVQQYKYLGVILSRNLCWSPHIQYICRKARKVLGIIYRMVSTNTSYGSTILKLYVALVRPHLEYAAQVWNPHLTKDINCLEKVQKFALRICSKHYHEPYQNLLEYYQLPLLQNRRLFLCLCTFHSIVNGLVYLPNETFLPPAVTVYIQTEWESPCLQGPSHTS